MFNKRMPNSNPRYLRNVISAKGNATKYYIFSFFVVGFYDTFNILGHQRRFRYRAWKVRQIFSEALISAWGSFTCRKSTTRDPCLYFSSEGSRTQGFYALKTSNRHRPGLNPRTSDPVIPIPGHRLVPHRDIKVGTTVWQMSQFRRCVCWKIVQHLLYLLK